MDYICKYMDLRGLPRKALHPQDFLVFFSVLKIPGVVYSLEHHSFSSISVHHPAKGGLVKFGLKAAAPLPGLAFTLSRAPVSGANPGSTAK
jgi:hypothetical protein